MARLTGTKKYEDIELFKVKIEEYFVKENYPWTISGLCLHLDITRETLCNYEKYDNYFDTIKRAKLKIENYAEKLLFSSATFTPGIVFNLKNNFGWKDKTEVESKNINENTNKNVELGHLTTEQIKELLNNDSSTD